MPQDKDAYLKYESKKRAAALLVGCLILISGIGCGIPALAQSAPPSEQEIETAIAVIRSLTAMDDAIMTLAAVTPSPIPTNTVVATETALPTITPAQPTSTPCDGEIFGFVDSPSPSETYLRPFYISGWAIADCGIDRIYVMIDGARHAVADYGGERHDVERDYPTEPNALNSGYLYWLDNKAIPSGPHRIKVVAIDLLGNSQILSPGEFTVYVES